MLLYIELEDYLAQWFRHEQGGTDPVRLTRGSIESGLLEQFLQTPPPDYVPDFGGDGKLAIELPNFRNKDIRSYYYLPPKALRHFDVAVAPPFRIGVPKAGSPHLCLYGEARH